jgi:tetratricopeptide (TPR) repeat protein
MNSLELFGFRAVVKELLKSNKRDKSWELLEHFFLKAKTLEEFDTIGQLCLDTEHRELHLQCAERSYAVAYTSQQRYAARTNLIKAYNTMNKPEKALFLIAVQLQINPDNYEMLCEKAANIALMGDKAVSESIINKLIETNPDRIITLQTMLSGKYLREGQLTKGVRSFVEGYKENNKVFDEQLKMKRWDGIPRPGKTLYVYGEGGIGDEIINIRFFKQIEKLGMQPILVTAENEWHSDKNNLFRRHGIKILCEAYSIDRSQYWTPMMSLPADLNLTEEDLWKGTYFKPLRQEKNRLKCGKFKIGIKCSGNPFFAQDEYRKIPLELMLSYLSKDADIYYIDKTKGHPGTIELADRIESWEDTLDFIDQMDCIVSSCTSLVHAAGAIGKTTFVAVPIAEYYIWTTSRKDTSSPWYGPNFHVMKQTQLRDWNEPLSKISEQVKVLISSNSMLAISNTKEKIEI